MIVTPTPKIIKNCTTREIYIESERLLYTRLRTGKITGKIEILFYNQSLSLKGRRKAIKTLSFIRSVVAKKYRKERISISIPV